MNTAKRVGGKCVDAMAYEYKLQRRVEFVETDVAQILHFSVFFVYMEQTEHAFLRSLGFSVHHQTSAGLIGFPRVAASCQFKHPLRFEDEVEVQLRVREKTDKLIGYDFSFYNVSHEPPLLVAHGSTTVICALVPRGEGRMRAVAIPDEISAAIELPPSDS